MEKSNDPRLLKTEKCALKEIHTLKTKSHVINIPQFTSYDKENTQHVHWRLVLYVQCVYYLTLWHVRVTIVVVKRNCAFFFLVFHVIS